MINDLLQRCADAYASCRSYRDEGEVTSVLWSDGRRHTTVQEFQTLFVRPAYFRFEFCNRTVGPREEWLRYVVWWDGEQIRSWRSLSEEIEVFPGLGQAVAAATGVSHQVSSFVPGLLMNQGQGLEALHQMFGAAGVSRERIAGREFNVLEQLTNIEERQYVKAWIAFHSGLFYRVEEDRDIDTQYLIRDHKMLAAKLREETKDQSTPQGGRLLEILERDIKRWEGPDALRAIRVETSIAYRPRVDSEIDLALFRFQPPTLGV